MAEAVVGDTTKAVLENQLTISQQQISLVRGFKKDMEQVKKSFFDDDNKQQVIDSAVKRWLRDLEALAFDANNVLDEINYQLLSKKVETTENKKLVYDAANGEKVAEVDCYEIRPWLADGFWPFENMKFNVTWMAQGMIAPSGVTPSGVYELSAIDRLPALCRNVPVLHVYKHGVPGAANVIREALSKALIYFYPLAGRLQFSDQNELQVIANCFGSNHGVWFVEASADCTLDAVNYFDDDDAMSIPYDKLLPLRKNHDHGLDDPLVQMQVTRFGCNGFVVGLITCHTIIDGVGTAQFVNAVGEMARGAEQPSIKPEWCRNFLPAPTRPFDDHLNTIHPIAKDTDYYLVEHATIDLSLDIIKDLKQEFKKWSQSHEGIIRTYCSTFEMSAAIIWRARTQAINPTDESNSRPTRLVFYANCRHLIPQLPKGFYGNCFFPVTVTAPSGRLTGMTVFQVVKLIQEAKSGLADEFRQWMLAMDTNPFQQLAPDYTTLIVTEWDRLGFKEIDYGWGKPVNIVPIQESAFITPIVVLCSPPPDKAQVLRFKTWCVQKQHLQHLFQNIDNIYETRA